MHFDYAAPESLADALQLLRCHGEDARIIAGGQSLVILLREGLLRPRYVVGLERVPGLSGVVIDAAGLMTIGAMSTYRGLYRSDVVRRGAGILARACESVGPLPIHSVGTIGGNVCHNAPGADPPPALLALDARAVLAGRDGPRTVPLRAFFQGMFETALGAEEICTAIQVPRLPSDALWGYLKFSPRAMDMAIASVAVVVRLGDDGLCREARLAVGGVASVPYRAVRAEESLVGRRLNRESVVDAAMLAGDNIEFISDFHASAAYRRRILPVLVRRAVGLAVGERWEGGGSSVAVAS